jgi:hypothetical protein
MLTSNQAVQAQEGPWPGPLGVTQRANSATEPPAALPAYPRKGFPSGDDAVAHCAFKAAAEGVGLLGHSHNSDS